MLENPKNNHTDALIIGGGAAGYFAAINIKLNNPECKVTVLEAGQSTLKKVKISGGGRCNVTHHCFEPRRLIESYPRGCRELLSVFNRFQPQDTVSWFKRFGVELKIEPDGRMFPATNSSQTIIDCFQKLTQSLNIQVMLGCRVTRLIRNRNDFLIKTRNENEITAKKVLMATGSDPKTMELIENLGQPIVSAIPSLFTFKLPLKGLENLAGQSVSNTTTSLVVGNKKFSSQGPILFTHWGASGPAILKLSAFAARELFKSKYQATLRINWLPNESLEQTRCNLNEKRRNLQNKIIYSDPHPSFSKRLWGYFCARSQIAQDKTWGQLSNKNFNQLLEQLHSFKTEVAGKGVFKEEFVTAGGVDLKLVDLKNLMSKKVEDLYFAGEILNVDGITGGFNFQNAWSTAHIAATHIAAST